MPYPSEKESYQAILDALTGVKMLALAHYQRYGVDVRPRLDLDPSEPAGPVVSPEVSDPNDHGAVRIFALEAYRAEIMAKGTQWQKDRISETADFGNEWHIVQDVIDSGKLTPEQLYQASCNMENAKMFGGFFGTGGNPFSWDAFHMEAGTHPTERYVTRGKLTNTTAWDGSNILPPPLKSHYGTRAAAVVARAKEIIGLV